MIRYRTQVTASALNDAIGYLKTKVTTLATDGWEQAGDVVVTETRNASNGVRGFRAATTLLRAE